MPRLPALLVACLVLQTPSSAAAAAYRPPRAADGHPDLQGVWSGATYTPFQRRKTFKSLVATEAEAAAWVKELQERLAGKAPAPKPGDDPAPPSVGDVESEWYEGAPVLMRIDGALRSSIITEPGDGRLPYNLIGERAVADALRRDDGVMDGPEDRHADERCLMALGSSVGPPMLPSGYNANYQIVQTKGVVAIHAEMIHDVRLVRMDAAHDAGPPRWAGDSIGRWEGDTLVVETVGQHPLTADRFVGPGVLHVTPAARVEERFTRTAADEIRYAFTVDDPSVFTRPWRGELLLKATRERMYEYACHEGNYALANILGGARKKEADAKATADKAKAPAPGAAKAKAD